MSITSKANMYRLFFMFLMFATFVARAQDKAAIRFVNNDSLYDFGTIGKDEVSTYKFEFKNTGTAPLTISAATCDERRMNIQYPGKPVKPGKKGLITVRYVPAADDSPGSFKTDIYIASNATEAPYPFLHVSGAVMPTRSEAVQKTGGTKNKQSRRAR